MSEPKIIVAGTKVNWTRKHAGNDSAQYQYILLSDSEKITINATYSANEISVEVLTATTAGYSAGHYQWSLVETLADEKGLITQGRLEIQADPTAATTTLVFTHNEKMLSSIRKRLEGRILTDHENYSVDGRSLSRIPMDTLQKLEKEYAWKVHDEQVARGERQKHRSVRFR